MTIDYTPTRCSSACYGAPTNIQTMFVHCQFSGRERHVIGGAVNSETVISEAVISETLSPSFHSPHEAEVREPDPDDYRTSDSEKSLPNKPLRAGKSVSGDNTELSHQALSLHLLRFADQLNEAIAVHHFYCDAVEALMAKPPLEINSETLRGLAISGETLKQQDQQLLDTLNALRDLIKGAPDS